jgi:hypothetical protein
VASGRRYFSIIYTFRAFLGIDCNFDQVFIKNINMYNTKSMSLDTPGNIFLDYICIHNITVIGSFSQKFGPGLLSSTFQKNMGLIH